MQSDINISPLILRKGDNPPKNSFHRRNKTNFEHSSLFMANKLFWLSKCYYHNNFHSSDSSFAKKEERFLKVVFFSCRMKLKFCGFSSFHKIEAICIEFFFLNKICYE